MAHELVKITVDDDGDEKPDPKWCLVDPTNGGGPATMCTAEFFGYGESGCVYEIKAVKRGGITCEDCLKKIRLIKAIKL